MAIEVIHPGMLTTIQDLGRYGFMDQGIPVSGAVDAFSMRIANILVGNAEGEAVLEMTMLGATLQFTEDAVIAVTGADMQLTINGQSCAMNQAWSLQKGSILQLGYAVTGCRSYLAVRGGLEIEPVMGSRSTYVPYKIGGYQGRALVKGDTLEIAGRSMHPPVLKTYTPFSDRKKIRVVKGPQTEAFAGEELVQGEYVIGKDSNRMACRLQGTPIGLVAGADIVSDGITTGSIQVTNEGQPIVMLADHQTTGGYAKIGTVISADIPLLAQKKPGETVEFEWISVRKAQKIYRRQENEIRRLKL